MQEKNSELVQDHKKKNLIASSKAVHNLHQCVQDMVQNEKFDVEEYTKCIKKSLQYNFKSSALLLFYIADENGLNKPEWVSIAIPIIAETPYISNAFRISFYKGLTKLGRWRLAVSFLDYKTNMALRNAIFNSIYWAINDKNVRCLRDLPRQGNVANRLRGYLKYSPKEWRKALSSASWFKLTTLMSSSHWGKIRYDKLSTVTLVNGYNAFMRHDKNRFKHFLHEAGVKGSEVVKHVLFPEKSSIMDIHDIFNTYSKYYLDIKSKGNNHGTSKNFRRTGSFKKANRTEGRTFKRMS